MKERTGMMVKQICFLAGFLVLTLGGCSGTWETSNAGTNSAGTPVAVAIVDPADVLITEGDLKEPYTVIKDIKVTVNKTTVFNADPTKEQVNEKLRKDAAKLGADAVILVRYGTVGVSPMSWGSLSGSGRAVSRAR
jgi:uncharacterized protein YbjQ (UPF0145 family)